MAKRSISRRSKRGSSLTQYQALEPRKMLAGDVIISEFVASNSGSFQDAYNESPDWIELHNQGDSAVNLQGYHLTDDPDNPSGWTFDSSLVISPGEYIVVSASGRDEVDFAGSFHTDFRLSAGGDYLALYDSDLNLKSEYGTGGTEYPQQITDISYGVAQNGVVAYLATPTPGQANSNLTVLGPAIDNVTDTTTIALGQSFTVTAEISQFDLPVDVSSPQLHYRFGFGNEITVPLTDGGTGADAVAGDGIFSATLDSSAVPAGELVRWYVTASDTDDNTSRAPRFADALDSAEYFGAVVADSSITTDITLIQWFVENEAAADTSFGTRASIFIGGNFYDNVQVDAHGQSTRGAAFLKKSYDFDANSGEKFDIPGIGEQSDFNLLTNFADQSKVRHSLAYEILAAAGIPALSGQATTVYRNGEFYALYDLVEEGQDEYLERVGLDPNGALYKVNNPLNSVTNGVSKDTRTYEDRSDFQEVVNANRNLSGQALTTWLYDNVDIPGLINYLAAQTILNNGDFGHKNMYWYRDTEGTGLWTPLPWDQDLSLGHRFTTSLPQPERYFDNALHTESSLNPGINSIFQHVYNESTLQDLFYQRLKTLSDQLYGAPGTAVEDSFVYQRLEELQVQLADEIALDSARWPLHPNYAAAFPFNPSQAIDQIQSDFISGRRDFINDNVNVSDSQVGIPAIEFDPSDFDSNPASGVQAEEYFRLNNTESEAIDISGFTLSGGVEYTFKAGTVIPAGGSLYVVADVVAFQNRASGPSDGQNLLIQGNYSGSIASDTGTVLTELPFVELQSSDGTIVDQSATPVVLGVPPNEQSLRISEINYNPADELGDAEFIEFLNTGSETQDLSGVAVTDGPSEIFVFPNGTTLAGGARILIVQDSVAFTSAYPEVPASQVAGEYQGSLSNRGEDIRVEGADGEEILDFGYDDSDPWASLADGEGASLVLVDELNTPVDELDKYFSWRASTEIGGTPGTASSAPSGVVINEVLAHTDAPQSDSIELFNRSDSPVDISGWWLSDSTNSPLKFQIPAGTVLATGAYIAFDESDFNPNPFNPDANDFALSASGDQVVLSQASGGVATHFEDFVEFDATFNGDSVGRLPNGTGSLTRLAANSLGSANGDHAVSDLVITEVNYHPGSPSAAALAIDPTLTENDLEFIEVTNHSNSAIDLANWRIRGDVDYDFGAGTSLAAGGTITLLNIDFSDPANAAKLSAFLEHYGLSLLTNLAGGIEGNLSNSSGRISLQQADSPDVFGDIPHVLVDEVVYDDLAPWADADGNGLSLQRDDVLANGNFATSWIADTPTPAFFEPQFLLGDVNQDGVVNFLDISPFITQLQSGTYLNEADANGDGLVNFLDISPFINLLSS